MLCYVMLCYVMLCYVTLCYVCLLCCYVTIEGRQFRRVVVSRALFLVDQNVLDSVRRRKSILNLETLSF